MDNGEWDKIAVALRDDRGMVEQRDGMAVAVRARTGATIGSVQDIPIRVLFNDTGDGRQHVALVRAGIPVRAQMIDGKAAKLISMADVLMMQDYRIEADGTIISKTGRQYNATPWANPGDAPYASAMCENWVLAVDNQTFMPTWIADLPMEDEEVGRIAINSGSQSMDTVGPGATGSNRASIRHAASDFSPGTKNRAQRRKQAAHLRTVT